MQQYPNSNRLAFRFGVVNYQSHKKADGASAPGQAPEIDAAVAQFRKAAEQGYGPAQNALGVMYRNGEGVPQDNVQAVAWWRKAADQGYAEASINLAGMYRNGEGVTQSYAEEMRWYRKAADQGHAHAQSMLGSMYLEGSGVKQDYAEAIKWIRKAAERGNASAQFNLGITYAKGLGVPQNYGEAVRWYRKAADQGDADAQNNLAGMYSNGEGVPQDFAEAVKWWQKAADQGNAGAQDNLAAQQVRIAQERRYKRTTFDDFMLDGKELATNSAMVSIHGVYVKRGEVEMLFPSVLSIAMARETLRTDAGIGLLTSDATRSLRKFLLDCRNNPVGAQIGCSLTVLGRASMCTKTTLVGATDVPCLIVEDGAGASPR